MAKRRITLSSKEMSDISARMKLLEAQLKRSNDRVEELEHSLGSIEKFVTRKSRPKTVQTLSEKVEGLVRKAINPPVKARENPLPVEELQGA